MFDTNWIVPSDRARASSLIHIVCVNEPLIELEQMIPYMSSFIHYSSDSVYYARPAEFRRYFFDIIGDILGVL